VPLRLADVLHRVDNRLVPRKGACLSVVDLRLLSVDGDLRLPISEVHAQAMRVAMARFGLARLDTDVQNADERVLERDLGRVGRHARWIECIAARLLAGKACSDDENRGGGKEQTFPGHDSLPENS